MRKTIGKDMGAIGLIFVVALSAFGFGKCRLIVKISPSIAIYNPTSEGRCTTKEAKITVSGLAGDNSGLVKRISWWNDRGGRGRLAGTTEWSVSDIALEPGDNVLNFTVKDFAGNRDTTNFPDDQGKVAQFKNLSVYDVVLIASHGNIFRTPESRRKQRELWELYRAGLITGQEYRNRLRTEVLRLMHLAIWTEEFVTSENLRTYELDFKKHRLVAGRKREIGNRIWVADTFIRYYNRDFPGTIVHGGFCYSAVDMRMPTAFLGNGAITYTGYSNIVNSVYARDTAVAYFDSLLAGSDTALAFEKAIIKFGRSDGRAWFSQFGAKDAMLLEGLTNGGFEQGTVDGWTATGDVRVLARMGDIAPQEGKYMALIGTGTGAANDNESMLKQSFCVLDGSTTLSFDYKFVSEEPAEWIETEFNDIFEAALFTETAKETIISEAVSDFPWMPVDGIDLLGGDFTTSMTDWKMVTYDVSSLQGPSVWLRLQVTDQGDNLFGTNILIDNVRLE